MTQLEQKPPTAPSLLTHHCVCMCVCLCGPDYTQEMPFLINQQATLKVTEPDHLRKVATDCCSRDGEAKPVRETSES